MQFGIPITIISGGINAVKMVILNPNSTRVPIAKQHLYLPQALNKTLQKMNGKTKA